MKNHKVSIIIPVYNIADYLEKCVQSCIEQTSRDIEIIIINDGSTDYSSAIIEKLAEQDKRIIFVDKKNEGVSLARKTGFDTSSGDFVFYLDGDDWIESDAIEKLYNKAVESEADIVFGNYFVVTNNEKKAYDCLINTSALDRIAIQHFMIDNYSFRIWGNLYKRQLHTNLFYPPINPSIGEDAIQVLQMVNKSSKIDIVKDNLYNYVIRETSIMNTNSNRSLKEYDCSIAIDQMLKHVCFETSVHNKLICLALEKLCIYISEFGDLGKEKKWAKDFLTANYFQSKSHRQMTYKKNKKVYTMLLLACISPKLVQKLSSLNKILKV